MVEEERGGEGMMGGCGAENNFVLSSGSKSSKVILYTKMWEFFLFFDDRQKRYFKFCHPFHVFTVLIVSSSRSGQKKATPVRGRNFSEDFWRKDNAHYDWTFSMSAWLCALPKVGALSQTKETDTTLPLNPPGTTNIGCENAVTVFDSLSPPSGAC